jgi:hypothetical protein
MERIAKSSHRHVILSGAKDLAYGARTTLLPLRNPSLCERSLTSFGMTTVCEKFIKSGAYLQDRQSIRESLRSRPKAGPR